jgi:hypothetical protein
MHELRQHGLGEVQVLARPHPMNPLLGREVSHAELATLGNVHLYPPAGANPTDSESRQDYFDSLYYCSVVTGVNTSAFLEAAIVGRPVLTVRAPRYEETQKGMLHFHHLLTAGGGLLHDAETYDEHAAQLREALTAPHPDACVSERSLKFTEAFIRPHGLDEPATPRMVATIEGLPERQGGGSPGPTLTGRVLARAATGALERARRRTQRTKHRRDRKASRAANAAKARRAKVKAVKAKEAREKVANAARKEAKAEGAREKEVKAQARAAAAKARQDSRKAKEEARGGVKPPKVEAPDGEAPGRVRVKGPSAD